MRSSTSSPLPLPDHVPPVAIVTDSSAQLPAELITRYQIAVAPIAVTIDGAPFREGIDLAPETFFARLHAGADITTSQPSPGDFVALYEGLSARGAEQILSIHVGSEFSGTRNSARTAVDVLGAQVAPITLMDTGTASFGVGACVWEAARRLAAGGCALDAQRRIDEVVPCLATSVLLDGLAHVRAGGRYDLDGADDATLVFSGVGSDLEVVGTGATVDELVSLLARPFAEAAHPIRAAVALADPATLPYTERLEAALAGMEHVVETTRYQVGPRIAAHTGPGTAGGFFWPDAG